MAKCGANRLGLLSLACGLTCFPEILAFRENTVENLELAAHEKLDERDYPVMWTPGYGTCSTQCGEGDKILVQQECMYQKNSMFQSGPSGVAPTHLCAELPQPAATIACESVEKCAWRMGVRPANGCGWSTLQCYEKSERFSSTEEPQAVDNELCHKAAEQELIPVEVEWRSRHALVNEGCPTSTLQTLCVGTVNYPAAESLIDFTPRLEHANERAAAVIKGCGDADVVVLANQEMMNVYGQIFDNFASGQSGYAEVGRCGARISSGVAVLVKTDLQKFFAPGTGRCFDDTTGKDTAFTNTKGSTIFELFTVKGKLIAASTHGPRGDVYDSGRVDMLAATARIITGLSEGGIVAWGGDFNTRTPVTASTELLEFGSTHPDTTSASLRDPNGAWLDKFDPSKAFELLSAAPDIFGSKTNFTMQQELDAAVGQGKLSEVPGVKNLCPTHKKVPKGKFKDTKEQLPGSGGKWFGKKAYVKEWLASFACRAPGSPSSDPPEYYPSPLDGKTKWPWSSPSWTDRLIVHTGAVNSCLPPQKARPGGKFSEEDHDAIYTRCDI